MSIKKKRLGVAPGTFGEVFCPLLAHLSLSGLHAQTLFQTYSHAGKNERAKRCYTNGSTNHSVLHVYCDLSLLGGICSSVVSFLLFLCLHRLPLSGTVV